MARNIFKRKTDTAPVRRRMARADTMWLIGVNRYDLTRLSEFDGRNALWRIAAAATYRCVPLLLTLLGFAAGIYAGVDLDAARIVLAAAIFLAAGAAAGWTARRQPWRAMILDRLQLYEDINPSRYTPVLLVWSDVDRAATVLRRAKLVPGSLFRQPAQIEGAYELTGRLNVNEPAALPQTETYDDFLALIASTLAAAGIRSRAAAFDAFPDGTVSRWDDPPRETLSRRRAIALSRAGDFRPPPLAGN